MRIPFRTDLAKHVPIACLALGWEEAGGGGRRGGGKHSFLFELFLKFNYFFELSRFFAHVAAQVRHAFDNLARR